MVAVILPYQKPNTIDKKTIRILNVNEHSEDSEIDPVNFFSGKSENWFTLKCHFLPSDF